jgi:hypothetical protein
MPVRMRFDPTDPDDEDAYQRTRQHLVDELERWLADNGRDPDLVHDATLALDWRYSYDDGDLDRWQADHAADWLLDWCPRKVSTDDAGMRTMPDGLVALVEMLADRGLLVGGAHAARQVRDAIDELREPFVAAMRDPANHGMGKSLLAALPSLADGDLADGDLADHLLDPDALAELMDRFNALPFEERDRILGGVGAGAGASPSGRGALPVHAPVLPHRPPNDEAIEASATASPLLDKVERLRTYLGTGRPLTARGNLKLVDGRALVELLDTGDEPDHTIGGVTSTMRSTDDLLWLPFIVEAAIGARAVRRHQGKLVPVQAWSRRDTRQRAAALADAALALGPYQLGWQYRGGLWAHLGDALDDAAVHLMAPGICPGVVLELDDMVEPLAAGLGAILGAEVLSRLFRSDHDHRDEMLRRDLARIATTLELAGLVRWEGSTTVADRFGLDHRGGGALTLTPLAHHVLPPLLERVGYRLEALPSVTDLDAAGLLDAIVELVGPNVDVLLLPEGSLLDTAGDMPVDLDDVDAEEALDAITALRAAVRDLASEWVGDRSPNDAGAEIVAAMLTTAGAAERLAALGLLVLLGPEVEAPVRGLLGGPFDGHALVWVLATGTGEPPTVDDPRGPVVDLLAVTLRYAHPDDRGAELVDRFDAAVPPDERLDVLATIWRLPLAEVADVLDELGRSHPDKAVAKAARKAAIRHRSAHPHLRRP